MASSPQYARSSRSSKPTHTPSASVSFSPLVQYQQAHNQGVGGGATAAQVQPPNARMSPASRYHSNLKVLRRRDPSITSIFDQFSHVCVYHHNGQKWEKHGFEGSMFLFERESYPPYGFYILNRVGSDDYIQRLYPEDDITTHGGYLMLRSYPQLSAARIDAVASASGGEQHKFSGMYAYAGDAAAAASKDKGESQTIGLWTFTTDGREPLMDVMLRLHSYIKKNLPYPDEYRYGPDRPPPPNPHLRAAAAAANTTNVSGHASDNASPNNAFNSSHVITNNNNSLAGGYDSDYSYHNSIAQQINLQGLTGSGAPSAAGNTELDKLFAKFLPPTATTMNATTSLARNEHGHTTAVPATSGYGFGPGASNFSGSTLAPSVGPGVGVGIPGTVSNDPQSAASMSVQSLFGSLGGPQQHQHQQQRSQISAQAQPYIGGPGYGGIGVGSMVVPPPPHLPFAIQQQQMPPPPTTGLSLLDSIFASASSAPTPPAVPMSVPLPQAVPQAAAGVAGQLQHHHQQQQLLAGLGPAGNYLHPLPSTATIQPYLPPPSIQSHPSLPPSVQHYPHLQPYTQQQQIPIYSPTPKSLPTPQVLSQNVIGSLLNCGGNSPSVDVTIGGGRKRQTGGTGGGTGADLGMEWESPTHSSSRDGDNELEELDDGSGSGSGGGASSEDGGGRGKLAQPALPQSQRGGASSAAGTSAAQIQAQGKGKEREKKGKAGKGGKNVMMSSGIGEVGAGAGLSVVSVAANAAVGGDVTPRPGFLVGDHLKNLTTSSGAATITTSTTSSTATSSTTTAAVTAGATPASTSPTQKQKQKNKPRQGRPLIPFESNSELWPYPSPQQDKDTTVAATISDDGIDGNENELSENGNDNDDSSSPGVNGETGEGDIVELDWGDISALSNLKEFERVQREQQQQRKKKGKGKGNVDANANAGAIGKMSLADQIGAAGVSGAAGGDGGVGVQGEGPEPVAGGKKKKKKNAKSKQERLDAIAKEREEIEKSWDFPDVTNPANWGWDPSTSEAGLVVSNGAANGRMHTNGTAMGAGVMNLNGKTVPIPKVFNDDSPPASPSPIPSPVVPLSPVRQRSSPRATRQKDEEFEFEYVHQPPAPRTPSPSPPSKKQEHERETEEGVEVLVSRNVNGSKKKKNRRKLARAKEGGGVVSPPPVSATPAAAAAVTVVAGTTGADDIVSSGDACELKSAALVDEEKLMKNLLNAIRSGGNGLSEQRFGSGSEKEVFVQEVRRLMESEEFVDGLWMGYLKSGEGDDADTTAS